MFPKFFRPFSVVHWIFTCLFMIYIYIIYLCLINKYLFHEFHGGEFVSASMLLIDCFSNCALSGWFFLSSDPDFKCFCIKKVGDQIVGKGLQKQNQIYCRSVAFTETSSLASFYQTSGEDWGRWRPVSWWLSIRLKRLNIYLWNLTWIPQNSYFGKEYPFRPILEWKHKNPGLWLLDMLGWFFSFLAYKSASPQFGESPRLTWWQRLPPLHHQEWVDWNQWKEPKPKIRHSMSGIFT